MESFHYVYILVSEADAGVHYTGLTDDLDARLRKHNEGDGRPLEMPEKILMGFRDSTGM